MPCAIRRRVLPQQVLRGHQHAGRTVSALQRIPAAECRLEVGHLAAIGQALDGFDGCVMRLHRQKQACADNIAIDADGARTAPAVTPHPASAVSTAGSHAADGRSPTSSHW